MLRLFFRFSPFNEMIFESFLSRNLSKITQQASKESDDGVQHEPVNFGRNLVVCRPR